jgi:hypothetical protein
VPSVLDASLAVLLLGLGYAAVRDWIAREVTDRLWQSMAILAIAIGVFAQAGDGILAWGSTVLVGLFVLEHLVDWDVAVERRARWLPGVLELVAYTAVGALLLSAAIVYGLGAGGLPLAPVLVFISVLVARAMFEVGLLYGGADAKALMVTGLLIPALAVTVLPVPDRAAALLPYYPFAVSVIVDAALLSVTVPLALAARNLARGEFEFPRGLTGFRIPVDELPRRFVWLKEPSLLKRDDLDDEVQTTAQDVAQRERQAADLRRKGIRRVWVTPQIPFLVFLAGGTILAILWGNVVFDLAALL